MQRVTQCLNELGLAQTRNAFQQHVTSREDRHQDVVYYFAVTDDDFGNFSADFLEFSLKGVQMLAIQLRNHRSGIIRHENVGQVKIPASRATRDVAGLCIDTDSFAFLHE